jgi:hypothetical protein
MVIVEPRDHPKLQYVCEEFHKKMPTQYTLYVFHGKQRNEFARRCVQNIVNDTFIKRDVILIELPTSNLTANQYNRLLKSRWFYSHIDAENILIFQTDAVPCTVSPHKIKAFEKFSYIGCGLGDQVGKNTYWGKESSFYGIGGLSFRKKSFVESCIKTQPHASWKDNYPEDVFFSDCTDALKPRTIPNATDLNEFCTQGTFDRKRPSFGAHKVSIQDDEQARAFHEYCPTYTGTLT